MAKTPLEVSGELGGDALATYVATTWIDYNAQRQPVMDAWKELRNYVFATDTTTTTNKKLPWKNSTTLPKLCQIRDNLHSNYISALFPNDDWLRWEGYTKEAAHKEKAAAIQSYMSNKVRESHFRIGISRLVYDYIDYGNCFATVEYESSFADDATGTRNINYIGPKLVRISPLDIVFNPLAESFKDSFKIVRSMRSLGALKSMLKQDPNNERLKNIMAMREKLTSHAGQGHLDVLDKSEAFMVDGYGTYSAYLQSGYVEFLDFYGDFYDVTTGTLLENVHATVVDRMWTVHEEPFDSWLGHAGIYHVGWRLRPDSLWAMGPLENLVGMQYRIDHLENLKADAMDLSVMPPLKIKGDVEQFVWGPGAEIHLDENGDVEELGKNSQWVIQADNSIAILEQKMEQYAGAPREAMGIRTPGEKTMFEVQSLQNAAGRIFQEKVSIFEIEFLECVLNAMLEIATRKLDRQDVIRVLDTSLGITTFDSITKEDITASGILRPIGARHFAAQAQMMQNLSSLANTPMWMQIAPHISAINLASLVEDILGLSRFSVFKPNVAVFEQQETARLQKQAAEDLQVEDGTPVDQ
jgi:hypothetical protein